MRTWAVAGFLALLLCLGFGEDCPGGGRCEDGHTCCLQSSHESHCCPFEQAECCGDHVHCCPAAMSCDAERSRCVNATLSVPWALRTPTEGPGPSKSFRMIKSNDGDDDDIICPDQSRCPAEYSCLRALTKYGCCPLAQGMACSDGKHCCPRGHSCSADSRSCLKKEVTATVLCSDGVSECPEESSCCEGADGEFGCCPMPQAVCCDDKVHCCPDGSLCDLQTSKCVSLSSKKLLPMWAKFPARRRAEWEEQKEEQKAEEAAATPAHDEPQSQEPKTDERAAVNATVVTCDHFTVCPDRTTCCSNGVGGWNCCPIINAVCCSDYRTCCPYLMKCDVVYKRCLKEDTSVPVIPLTAAVTTTVPVPVQSEPGQSEPTESEEEEKEEEEEEDDGGVQCKAHKHFICPKKSTCCENRKPLCCPLPNATCCSDGKHCCPHNYNCVPERNACARDELEIPWYRKVPARPSPAPPASDNVVKPDERASIVICDITTTCPSNTTCCRDLQGQWACCNSPNAVCCSDHMHCCPHGTTCNLILRKCIRPSDLQTTPMTLSTPAMSITATASTTEEPRVTDRSETEETDSEEDEDDEEVEEEEEEDDVEGRVPCEGHKNLTCPKHTTCCKSGCHKHRCCPMSRATCCPDGRHCCPDGFKCHHPRRACVRDGVVVPWYKKIPAESSPTPPAQSDNVVSTDERASFVQCNATEACPDDTTCCTNQEGDWSCCLQPQAVCCSDHMHCCPHGTSCDLVQMKCVDPSNLQTTPMMPRTPTIRTSAVPSTTHTQQTESEEEEEEEEQDDDDDDVVDIEGRVPCNGHKNLTCPRNSTCCRLGCRKRRCCPMPRATCCSDGKHCCPHKFHCRPERNACARDELEIPWYLKVSALPRPAPPASDNVVKADDRASFVKCNATAECPNLTTCCQDLQGSWGCCNLPNAVCCNDHMHCCPHGTQCDLEAMKCVPSSDDTTTAFPQTSTMMPRTLTVTTADIQATTPEVQVTETSLSERTEGEEEEEEEEEEDVDLEESSVLFLFPGKSTRCSKRHRCPLRNASCCPDGRHCCPNGFKCHPPRRACAKDGVIIPWYISISTESGSEPPLSVEIQVREGGQSQLTESEEDGEEDEEVEDEEDAGVIVPCKGLNNSLCPKNSTCCGSRKKVCCRLPKATCCRDGKHCCPHKYKCHPPTNTCVKDGHEIPWNNTGPPPPPSPTPSPPPIYAETKEPEQSQTEPGQSEQTQDSEEEADGDDYDDYDDYDDEDDDDELVQCDPRTVCPKGTTCCNLGQSWGCCPLPRAVCCSDGEHCCPHRYKCCESRGACVRDDGLHVPWFTKMSALSRTETGPGGDVRCSDGHRCPDSQTCCHMSPEEFGCCPLENAVCCSDQKHCCPGGFRCDDVSQSCVRLEFLELSFVPITPATSGEKCGSSVCSTDEKCCRNRGMLHCCPFKDGVCCDTRTCCKSNESCDDSGGCKSNRRNFWEKWSRFFTSDQDEPNIL